jgi:ATP-binding cassette subfamily B protein
MAGNDAPIARQLIRPGTVRRILRLAAGYRWRLALLLLATLTIAVLTVASPLILGLIINDGIEPRRPGVVAWLCVAVAAMALVEAGAMYVQAWFSGRIGEGVVYELRSRVFTQVQKQPMAFFTRVQTGALISRLNNDIIGARNAVTSFLTQTASTILTLIIVLVAMFYLSWQISLAALLMAPLFLIPTRLITRRLQRLTRERMQQDAEVSSMMTERFNVSGAMLAKLYGRPENESALFAARASRVRDISITAGVYGRLPGIIIVVFTALITIVVYGLGGTLAIDGILKLGTLVAMMALLMRLYDTVNQLSTLNVNVTTGLVGFDRVFEVLDLEPLVAQRPGARKLTDLRRADGSNGAPEIEFERICFRYPEAHEVSLASLESAAHRRGERTDGSWVLRDVSFRAPAGKLTALVGPSGAGKTTITQLVPRLYDPAEGIVRIGGHDIKDLILQSLDETIGVVTQDAYLFHDTLRANLEYARPEATEQDLIEACKAALIWDIIAALPDGLDTMVGDDGYRLSGGEKQRIALARLLLKAPPVVVLDEATAHLDSESEAAIQRALKTVLAGRTSLVIAHRLSTVREADQILVVEAGGIRERGTHDDLLAAGGLYAHLYYTQFAEQFAADGDQPGQEISSIAAE